MKTTTIPRRAWGALLLCGALLLVGAGILAAQPSPFRSDGPSAIELAAGADRANPPLPPESTFPIQLVLDDDSAEGSFGFPIGAARQFLWFNRFSNPGAFTLEEIWVLFPATDVPLSGEVQIVVYQDPDGDPSNGASLLASFTETVQAIDGDTFSVYPLAVPLDIGGGGDILIGVVNRYFAGAPPTTPAAFDTDTALGRSYFALWAGDAPDPPDLTTADTVDVLSGAVTGTFMIRAFGTQDTLVIPTLGSVGEVTLLLLLALAGVLALRSRLF